MAELLLGMVRGRGVGARVGRECHQGRFGADPAMAANSSSEPSPTSAPPLGTDQPAASSRAL
jgi:hypothetical protein